MQTFERSWQAEPRLNPTKEQVFLVLALGVGEGGEDTFIALYYETFSTLLWKPKKLTVA
jgi:hypothetical protein